MCAEGSLSSSLPLRLTTKARRDRPSMGDRSLGGKVNRRVGAGKKREEGRGRRRGRVRVRRERMRENERKKEGDRE